MSEGNGINISGVGSGASPFAISVEPDPAGLVTVGPAGVSVTQESVQDAAGAMAGPGIIYDDAGNQLRVRISGVGGNTIVFGADQGIYAAPGAIALGPGLENGVGGVVQVNTPGPFSGLTRRACDDTQDSTPPVAYPGPDTAGAPVYVAASGDLRTLPEKMTEVTYALMTEAYTPEVSAFPFTSGIMQASVVNPSSQHCMCGFTEFAALAEIAAGSGTVFQLLYEIDLGLGAFVPVMVQNVDNRGKSAVTANATRIALAQNDCLDPAETKVVRFRVNIVRGIGDNGGSIILTTLSREIRFVGASL